MFQCQFLISRDLLIADLDLLLVQLWTVIPFLRMNTWSHLLVPLKGFCTWKKKCFTEWTCDAVEKLVKKRGIIRRALRGTGVGIDTEGKIKNHIRFPGFESYIPPERDEEHQSEELTEQEIQASEKKEEELQKQNKNKQNKEEKERTIWREWREFQLHLQCDLVMVQWDD